jgi:hypothetical protein
MRARNLSRPLEVETRTLDELREVLAILDGSSGSGGGAAAAAGGQQSGSSGSGSMITRIMLDNMTKKDSQAPGLRGSQAGRLVYRPC